MEKIKQIINSNQIKTFSIITLVLFTTEIMFILFSEFDLLAWSTLRIFLGNIILALIISLVTSYLPKLISYIITFISLLFFVMYAMFQLGFKDYLGVYASLNASSQAGAVKDYILDFFKSFNPLYIVLLLPLLITIFLVYKFDKDKEEYNITLIPSLVKLGVTSLIIIFLSITYYFTLNADFMQKQNQTISLPNLFTNPSVPTTSVSNFGVYAYLLTDVKSKVFGYEEYTSIVNIAKPSNPTDLSRTFDDTLWQSISDNETSDVYKTLHEYLINNETTSMNEYTGLFENKNVIVVMMESVNDIILNEEYFPNFAKLLDNGYYYENNYSPRNSCPTGNNEFSALTGLYSIYNSCTANVYKNNQYPNSLFNLFNEQGYNTVSMHNYTDSYYYRNTIHPNMGVDKYYDVYDLDIEFGAAYQDWSSDKDFAESAMNIMFSDYNAKEEPFALWLTTVSAHQPYTVSNAESLMYKDLFQDTDYSSSMKNYLSKLKVTDDLFGVLLDSLEKEGILDDTVIVAFGDHYPYGLDEDEMADMLGRTMDGYEADKTPFIIYNPSLEGQVISDYTTFMNILPTISNLFNLNYDPRLSFGKDLFSPEYESRAVFSDGSWKNEYAFYDASTGNIDYYTDYFYSEEDLNYINTKISNDIQISSLMIRHNYFEYLDKKLEEEKLKLEKEEVLEDNE